MSGTNCPVSTVTLQQLVSDWLTQCLKCDWHPEELQFFLFFFHLLGLFLVVKMGFMMCHFCNCHFQAG